MGQSMAIRFVDSYVTVRYFDSVPDISAATSRSDSFTSYLR